MTTPTPRPLRKQFPLQSLKKEYEAPEVINKFEPIRQYLLHEAEDTSSITNKALAQIVCEFLMFQEKYLGVEVILLVLEMQRQLLWLPYS